MGIALHKADVMQEERKKLTGAWLNDFISQPFIEADLIASLLNCLK